MTRPARLSIGTLRLTGFPASEARRVEAGFRAELARAEPAALPDGPPEDPRLSARVDRRGSPERIGAAAARALLESLRK